MWVDAVFTLGSALAARGWLPLASGERWPKSQRVWAATVVPLLLAAACAAIFPALYVAAPGGFSSVEELLVLLNADRRIALAGWFHYFAFDLLVGSLIVDEARARGMAAAWRIPALALTFLFGPAGWLWFRTQVLLLGDWPQSQRTGARGAGRLRLPGPGADQPPP